LSHLPPVSDFPHLEGDKVLSPKVALSIYSQFRASPNPLSTFEIQSKKLA